MANKTTDDNPSLDNTTVKRHTRKKKAPPILFRIHGVSMDNTTGAQREIERLLNKREKGLYNCAFDVAHFFLFMYERQMMWVRRNEGQDGPLSESSALQTHAWCNNYRELDRGTTYFRAHVLELWDASTKDGMRITREGWLVKVLWAALSYRQLNKVETFVAFADTKKKESSLTGIPGLKEWNEFERFGTTRKATNIKIFTGGHQNNGWSSYCVGMSALARKHGKKLRQVAKRIHTASLDDGLEQCYLIVRELSGMGPFFAWQVICDLLESQCLAPCTEDDWVQLGPGAKKGIDIIFNKSQASSDYVERTRLLHDVQDEVYELLGLEFPRWDNKRLSLKTLEHALCEFCKYFKVEGSCSRRIGNAKLRKFESRQVLDDPKLCLCGESNATILSFCDCCLNVYCHECVGGEPETSPAGWKCRRCTDFENISFAD